MQTPPPLGTVVQFRSTNPRSGYVMEMHNGPVYVLAVCPDGCCVLVRTAMGSKFFAVPEELNFLERGESGD